MISYLTKLIIGSTGPIRILFILGVMILLHLMVILVRRISKKVISSSIGSSLSKSKTVASLLTSVVVFVVYFSAFGLVLNEFGVSLTAYLASASIVGLAIAFGSQGLVQDIVNGLTVVFSGLFNVGDMVEISGQVGIVQSFGMRFTIIENSFGAIVYLPNRTITNVVRYPLGYIRAIADITLPGDQLIAKQMRKKVSSIVSSTFEQLSGILLTAPSNEGQVKTSSGKEFLRIKFCLWPGRGTSIETIFKQEVVSALKEIEPNYQEWMVSVNYEVERKVVPV